MMATAVLKAVEPDDEEGDVGTERDREIGHLKAVRERLLDVFKDVETGFQNQADRSNSIMDHWDAYKCQLSSNQYYNGNSRIFMPIISTAVQARSTRFANQLFPQSGRYVDVTTENGDVPWRTMALLEHYVRLLKLKIRIVKPLIKNGDCEGQYSIYVDWKKTKRHVASKKLRPVNDKGEDHPEYGEVEDIKEEKIEDGCPSVEVLSDTDLLIMPVTATGVEDALMQGGSVTVRRRWSKATLRSMIEEGDIDKTAGEAILDAMRLPDQPGRRDTQKHIAEAAGIRVSGGGKFAMVYETWTRLKVEGEMRLCRAYYGGDDIILGCKLNPFWNDKCPVISYPVDADAGLAKGRAPVADALDLQIYANDLTNEAADVSHFAAMPIVMADPEKNPKSATMVLGLGAVWDVDPQSVQFAQFPPLYKDLLQVIDACRQQVYQILGVNPAMMPQSSGRPGAKRNQAEIAMETAVDILTTAEAVSVLAEVLTEMLQRFADLDHQFRDKPLTVRAFGEFGRKANMETIEPIQEGHRYEYTWLGVENARNAAMAQQQIAFLSTLVKIPPQLIKGYVINLAAAIQQITLNQMGPRIAPLTVVSDKDQQSMDAHEENMLLQDGFPVSVHPSDDDIEHVQVHMMGIKQFGDPSGNAAMHVAGHLQQRQAKALAAAQKGGGPSGGGRGPQPGSQPQAPRPGPRVPGAIPADRMAAAGAAVPPRRA